jgi:rRNA-processing protein FCF1
MDIFLSNPTDHNHAPIPERIPAIELKNTIKARAAISEESTSVILHSSLQTFPLNATSELPRTEMLMQTIRRQRQAPVTTSTDELTDDLRQTFRGENFILYEATDMIIFTTKSNLSALKQSKHWFVDGTFKVCD